MREFTKLASALMILLLSSAIAMGQLDPPTNLTSTVVNDNDVVLSWNAPGGGSDFFEDFEGGTLPTGWLAVDNDGDGFNWINTIEQGFGFEAYEGLGAMTSASYDNTAGALTPDNYLITPAIEIGAASTLSYWHAAQDADWADEFYYVKLSTTGTDLGDFTEILWSGVTPANWAEITIDLSAYAGNVCYIAFQHTEVTDMFWMKLDNVSVSDTRTRSASTPKVTASANQGMPFRTSGMSQDEISETYANYITAKSARDLTGYNVYLDGEFVGNTPDTFWQYTDLIDEHTYTAGVSAVYDDGESNVVNYEFLFGTVGVSEILENAISVFPNPATYNVNIQSEFNITDIVVYDYVGKVIYTIEDSNTQNVVLNTSSYRAGMYIVSIRTENGVVTTKRVVITK